MTHIWQLFLRDIYDPIWPNIAASGILYIFVMFKLNALKRFHKRQHADMKQHLTALHEQTRQHISDSLANSDNPDKTFFADPLDTEEQVG